MATTATIARAEADADAAPVRSRIEQKSDPLYVGRVKVHPKAVDGKWRRFKTAVLVLCLAVYYAVPWIRWDRGPGVPDQAVLADFSGQRFYFFWLEIWPQEIYYITGLLILAALGLFLATSLFGRVWCGFTCPQTVWTDLFMFVERRIEGDRGARIRLDKQPWNRDKIQKRALKHSVWLVIALLTGGAWIMYFTDAPTLARTFFTGEAGPVVYFFVGLFTLTTYLLAGHAREQVCTYMCPWPRIQASLLDEESRIVTYQTWRGEPRKPLKRNEDWDQRGDCIDCKACVAVCPTGIDIRDGLQMECIGCSLCIDACNEVMDRIHRPRELITVDSERSQRARAVGLSAPPRYVRPRTIVYVVAIALLGALMLGALALRSNQGVTVQNDRNPLFVRLSNGDIRNGYTLKILNKLNEPRRFDVTTEGIEGARLFAQGGAPADRLTLEAAPNGVTAAKVYVVAPPDPERPATADLTFRLTDEASGEEGGHGTVFRSPAS
ncbi:MAG: cytochrome c oxidase accessory protein CcoG [Geminicoccaceae bacterium]|nr:cytochrome c oxidase accessory protein CcoG [Geminicoccaceae bacterium]